MARPLRIESPGAFYHVTSRGNEGKAIFRSEGSAGREKLVAGRTGQEYNQRKGRRGAFWEDRYHAMAVAGVDHLFRCLVYIDMNMVPSGIVKHPSQWPFFCGGCKIHPGWFSQGKKSQGDR